MPFQPTLPTTTEESEQESMSHKRRNKKKLTKERLQTTIDTSVLHPTVNEDEEAQKLTTESMNPQRVYDDDNTECTAQELKDTIKEEHD
eukprot:5381992-Amphidinium_carterae.1